MTCQAVGLEADCDGPRGPRQPLLCTSRRNFSTDWCRVTRCFATPVAWQRYSPLARMAQRQLDRWWHFVSYPDVGHVDCRKAILTRLWLLQSSNNEHYVVGIDGAPDCWDRQHVTPCERITLNTVPMFNLQTCDRPARYLISEALESCMLDFEPPCLLPFGPVSMKDLETSFKIESWTSSSSLETDCNGPRRLCTTLLHACWTQFCVRVQHAFDLEKDIENYLKLESCVLSFSEHSNTKKQEISW